MCGYALWRERKRNDGGGRLRTPEKMKLANNPLYQDKRWNYFQKKELTFIGINLFYGSLL
jgi:hypothetical protein